MKAARTTLWRRTFATWCRPALRSFGVEETESLGMTKTRDADILGLLVFLQRFELDQNNGRRKGRAFLDALRRVYADEAGSAPPAASSSLILP